MDEINSQPAGENQIMSNEGTPVKTGKGGLIFVLVVLLVLAGAGIFLFTFGPGSSETEREVPESPQAVEEASQEGVVEEAPLTAEPTLTAGNSDTDIQKDLDATEISAFESDFKDLQNDTSGL